MPRRNPLPERESAICERLLRGRREALLSRAAAAKAAQVDSAQFARYELKRAPVRIGDACRICGALNIDLGWLATGQQCAVPVVVYLSQLVGVRPDLLLSEAFDVRVVPFLTGIIEDESRKLQKLKTTLANLHQRIESGRLDGVAAELLSGVIEHQLEYSDADVRYLIGLVEPESGK